MKLKYSNKLKTAVIASVLALGLNSSVLGATWESIGTGDYSWDRDWEFIIDYESDSSGDDYTRTEKKIKYVASTGNLYWYQMRDANNFPDYEEYVLLGKAQDIFGEGITEDEIKDLIANIEGDQTVNGSQTVTGQQQVQGGLFILKLR